MLENIVSNAKRFLRENKELLIYSSFVLAAGLIDSYFTSLHLSKRDYAEHNIFMNHLIKNYGIGWGLYFPKIAGSILAITAARELDKENKIPIRGKHLLFGAGSYWSISAISQWYCYWII